VQIFIPTRDRLEAQYTWDNLTPALQAKAVLVCPAEEVQAHLDRGRNAIARPPVRLPAVRQWIVSTAADQNQPVIMLDDDLGFFRRKSPDAYNLMPISRTPALDILFYDLEKLVRSGKYAHAGLSPRQANNRHFPQTLVSSTRVNAVHCVNPKILAEVGVSYDAVDMMEDYHVTLTLLQLGYDNAVIVDGAWDQVKGSGAPGGFSHYRTKEKQAAAAYKLAELHPGYVRVVEKEPKTGQGDNWGGTRIDVRCYWTRAFKLQPLGDYTPPPIVTDYQPGKSYRKDRDTRQSQSLFTKAKAGLHAAADYVTAKVESVLGKEE
jgi:hypothetical protein